MTRGVTTTTAVPLLEGLVTNEYEFGLTVLADTPPADPVAAVATMGEGTERQTLPGQKEVLVSRSSMARAALHQPGEEVQEPVGQLDRVKPLGEKKEHSWAELALLQEQTSTKVWQWVLLTRSELQLDSPSRTALPMLAKLQVETS